MEFNLWLSLVVICILGALSPGPSLAIVIKNTLNGGVRQGYATAISHGLGVALYAAITATGIGLLIVQSPMLFTTIKYAGATFLLYLGIKALMSKQQNIQFAQKKGVLDPSINGWRDGFFIAFLNPKLAIFFLALFSQLVEPGAGWQQKAVMTATVGIIDMLWYVIIAFTMSRGPILEKLKANCQIVDKVTGSFLILLAARVVLN
jgi:threonine/homoserine/homoserine lactone efflux protein